MIRSAAKLSIGIGIAQAVTLLSYAVLGRIYSPAQFGTMAMVIGVSTILGVTVACRYDMTVLLPKSLVHAQLAQFTSMLLAIINSFIAATVMAIIAIISGFAWSQYWLEIAVIGLCSALIQICNFRQNRAKQFTANAVVQVFRAVAVFGFSAGFYKLHGGLILGQMAGSICALVLCLMLLRRMDGHFIHAFSLRRVRVWLRKHLKFMQFSLPAIFANSFTAQLPLFLINSYFGANAVGYFNLAQRTVMAPVQLISGAINNVYLQRLAELNANRHVIFPFVSSITRKTVFISMAVAMAFSGFCLTDGYSLVFGTQWRELNKLSLLLMPMLLIAFISKCVSGFAVLGRNELGLIYQCILATCTILAFWTVHSLNGNFTIALIVYSITMAIAYLAQTISIHTLACRIDKERIVDANS